MGAKATRTPRSPSGDVTASASGPPGDTGIYHRASRYREELMEEARTLRRAGKIRSARGVESRMRQVDQLLGALEGEGRAPSSPKAAAGH